jgi:hypothetical protein
MKLRYANLGFYTSGMVYITYIQVSKIAYMYVLK